MQEYIRSKDLALLIRDTVSLIDKRVMDHGMKTAYLFCKMLECTGKYEMFEIADLSVLAMLHDIGAYKTDDTSDMLRFEIKEFLPHSVYGYLFMKFLSPLEEQSKIILYHNTDYSVLKGLKYKYAEEANFLNLAEKVVIYQTAMGSTFDVGLFNRYAGTKYSEKSLTILSQAVKKYDVLSKISNGAYAGEVDEILDYALFSDDEKDKYIQMLMYCTGFRSEYSVVDCVTCMCICEKLAKEMGCTKGDRYLLRYAAIVHDIGMLAIPKEITDAARKLTQEEFHRMQKHIGIAEKIFNNRLAPEVAKIALAHHERGDGSGYPKRLTAKQITMMQGILALADTVTGLVNKRSYRDPFPKEKVLLILREEMAKNKYYPDAVTVLTEFYDSIMADVKVQADEILTMHKKLIEQFEMVYKKSGS